MKKSKLMLGTVMMLAVLLVAGGTLAWFTAKADPVVNEFTAGTLKMNLVDSYCEATNVNPGDCIDKVVFVENTGTKRMFVRIKLTPEFPNMSDADLNLVDFPILNGWVLHTDGYYYYPHEVLPGADTPNLIKKVCFDGPGMGNEYQGAYFTLTVESEAIQVTNGAALAEWGVYPPDFL